VNVNEGGRLHYIRGAIRLPIKPVDIRCQQGRIRNDLLVVEKLICLRGIRNYHNVHSSPCERMNGYYKIGESEVSLLSREAKPQPNAWNSQ